MKSTGRIFNSTIKTTGEIMKRQTSEEFNKVEKLKLTADVFVAGKAMKAGETVSIKGNDKVQLLASNRAVRVDEPKETKK